MKRKLLAILTGAAALICCAFGLAACNETGCKTEWEDMDHIEYKAPTCTASGNDSYVYCPTCKTYWTSPHKKGRETTPEQMKIPALGHSYSDGKCTRCGKTDPGLLPDTLQIPDLDVSNGGMLTWGGIKVASKYRVEITDADGGKHVYEVTDSEETALNLTALSDEYELAYGKNYASITAYKPYSENIDGETIADDIPVSESKTDFIAIRQNSGYSFTQLTYADEYLTVNGAYSDVRTDGDKEYILIEQQIDADAQSVRFNLASKVKTASGVTVKYFKDENRNQEIDNWTYMYVPAGATDIYVRAFDGNGTRDYVVRILTVKPVDVSLIRAVKSGDSYNFTTLMSHITIIENDYVDINMFYSQVPSSSEVVVDEAYNAYERTADCVMPLSQTKTYSFYVVHKDYLNYVQADLEKYSEAFTCKFIWGDNGTPSYWTLSLRYDYAKTAVYVPAKFGYNDTVILTTNTLGYSNNLEKVVFESGLKGLTSAVFTGCTKMREVYIPASAKGGLGDFLFPAALKDTLTVYFEGEISNDKWNQISGGGFKYFNTVKNTPLPTFEQVMG